MEITWYRRQWQTHGETEFSGTITTAGEQALDAQGDYFHFHPSQLSFKRYQHSGLGQL